MCGTNTDCGCNKSAGSPTRLGTGIQTGKSGFSNCCGRISNASGADHPLGFGSFNNAIGLDASLDASYNTGIAGGLGINLSAQPTGTTTPTTNTSGSVLQKAGSVLGTVINIFGKKETAPAPAPVVEEKKIPTAVWVAGGALVVLIVVYLVIKSKKG